ncbi:MAG: CinA family nicotinamide mononucleotide deamidase-related protein [Deltaproteobacteria bacterium]|nr:CinA family nicotinamide mononucleotide deamidase-related protein [Deltaproteobacteria bacterium]MBW1949385.1 CinA family nicotinamide mononucleotide deamidase-related protein [Deltaproteobacteria bacterium]MBW2007706.1 CinA family nicotinamide mononucleotide deamidase-related protein [Deltaproteobacteria bacterium]
MVSPKCEIVTIGTELLLGQIVDTNTTYLARELGRIGVEVVYRTAVGDRMEEIVQVLQVALGRCDLVLSTGGIGPTLDDMTREAVARVGGVPLVFREDLMAGIEGIFRRYGYTMSENNRRQAYVPQGSTAISNPVGTAPGFILEVEGKPVISLPGVPSELEFLMTREVIPWLRKRYGLKRRNIKYRLLKVVGLGESKVDAIIGDLMKEGANPEVGLLASVGEITIRIAAAAESEEAADALIEPVEQEIISRLGDRIFGKDDETLEGVMEDLLASQGLTLSILETFTGGKAAQRLHRIRSRSLLQGITMAHQETLAAWLGDVPEEETVVEAAAEAVRVRSGADVGLAIVGFIRDAEKGLRVRAASAVRGPALRGDYGWEMGGDLPRLQERGALVGLNTLRLTLLKHRGEGGP